MKFPDVLPHQNGEVLEPIKKPTYLLSEDEKLSFDTFGGRVHVEWEPASSVTPLGQLPFFMEFLKLGNLLEPWIKDCPLHLTSPNAPSKNDVLGTLLLSILAGHRRYAHVTTIRCDNVNPSLLGMDKIVSEDSLRRSLLDRLPKHQWPEFIRGDCAFGSDGVMNVCEEKDMPYLFKIKQTKNVKRFIEKLMLNQEWCDAGQGWQGQASYLQLIGWAKSRRVIVLRKKVTKDLMAVTEDPTTKQLSLNLGQD